MGNVMCCISPSVEHKYSIGATANANVSKCKGPQHDGTCVVDSNKVPTDLILNLVDPENGPAKGLAYQVHWLGPPLPPCEDERTKTVQALNRVGGAEDPEISSILKLTASMFKAPVALVALFDQKKVFVCDSHGGIIDRGDFPWRWTLCAWSLAYNNPQILVVPDTHQDVRFRENAKVTGFPNVRFYCGTPLIASNGHRLGTLCFADAAPRPDFDAGSCSIMNNLSELVVRHLEKDIALQLKAKDNKKLQTVYSQLQRTLDCIDHCVLLIDVEEEGWTVLHTNSAWSKITGGLDRTAVVGARLQDVFAAFDGSELPTPELVDAAKKRAEFQVLSARLKLPCSKHVPLTLTFRPGNKSGLDDYSVPIGVPSFLAQASQESARYYFMSIDLPKKSSYPNWRDSNASSHVSICSASSGTPVDGLELGHMLGKGSFGRVYYGIWMGTPVAVKVVDQDVSTLVSADGTPFEAILGQGLRHPNIVSCLKYTTIQLPTATPSWTSTMSTMSTLNTGGSKNTRGSMDHNSGCSTPDASVHADLHLNNWHVFELQEAEADKIPPTMPADYAPKATPLEQTWMLMEYCDRGCLQEAIDRGWLLTDRSALTGMPNMPAVLATAREVGCALQYLHSNHIVHGDLNSWNVMLCRSGVGSDAGQRGFIAKVADFGLARALDVKSRIETKTYGTLTHMPPETLQHGIVSTATDVYSYGVLLWQIMSNSRPWSGLSHGQILMAVVHEKRRLVFPDHTPAGYRMLAEACMDPEADKRPPMEEVVHQLDLLAKSDGWI